LLRPETTVFHHAPLWGRFFWLQSSSVLRAAPHQPRRAAVAIGNQHQKINIKKAPPKERYGDETA
jgi:hypothetical protein